MPLLWSHLVSPFSMLFCFLCSSFFLSILFWSRLLRSHLPNFFSQMNPWWVLLMVFSFLFMLLIFLYREGFLPWKPNGFFLSRLKSLPGGLWLYHKTVKFFHLLYHSQNYVFMFFWEKISPQRSLFLSSGATFFWVNRRKSFFFFYFLILCFMPRVLVLSVFIFEAFFAQSFHYFYTFMPLLLGPFLYNCWWCFWDAWAAGIIQHVSQFYLHGEEKETNPYAHSSPRPLDEPSKSFWLSLWKISVSTHKSIDDSRDIYGKFNPWLSFFLWTVYFLGWSSILLRFFILA